MKLQHKLAFYNTFTKIAIIAILGTLIISFVENISVNSLKQRMVDKRDKFVSNLSVTEINELLQQEKSFTDYNILKEEYIVLTLVNVTDSIPPQFVEEQRSIEKETGTYLILWDYFQYGGKKYRLEIGESMEAVKRIEKNTLYFTLLILLITVSLTLVSDLAFTRFLLRPFYKIVDEKLNRVNDPIHFNYEKADTTTDDFLLLDSSISGLMKKVSDQLLTEKQFISNVSHELLTPISVLRNRLENMLNDDNISVESLNKISASLKTLTRLKAVINSLLLISKVENQQFNKSDNIQIKTLIAEVMEELEDRLDARHITFENNLTTDYYFTGNQALLHTLFMNLLNNAVKYNKESGKIIISDAYPKTGYQIFISDEGVGMNEQQIEKAFTRFEKFSDRKDSHGLGLAIVKSIASFHYMEISMHSEPEKGTTIAIDFRK
ncbi:sensor histidine kinase [Pedobacter sp. HMF7647]|uniref:histidine kinase n=1 Tax=Hufsiella arboris TaxID=2695275 RepID=A0A7K1YDR5_9SPHI|nr:HAMP domain-containing sensor histidine kinase [Hufsiella arboris]MXV52747.1 sensor histidine kinase [Hufsiella arboris]